MGTEKFCLKWNDFEANISHAFRDIRDAKDFLDVTLVCEEDEQLQAHKVILSACSPFFRKILQRNPHQHPLLYLKGVKFADLQSVLNFMYHGEVNVAQDELNSFLAVAEELKVKGLTQNNSSSSNTKSSPQPAKSSRSADRESSAPPAKRPRPSTASAPVVAAPPPPPQPEDDDDDDIQEVVPVKSEPRDGNSSVISSGPGSAAVAGPPGDIYSPQAVGAPPGGQQPMGDEDYGDEGEYEDYSGYGEGYDSSVMDPNMTGGVDGNKGETIDRAFIFQYIEKLENNPQGRFQCKVCHKYFRQKSHCENHIESRHFSGSMSYNCKYCGEQFTGRNKLYIHTSKVHVKGQTQHTIPVSVILKT